MPDPGSRPIAISLTYSPRTQTVAVAVDESEVLSHLVGMLIAAPAQVAIGENFSDFGLTPRRFTGRLRLLEKSVSE